MESIAKQSIHYVMWRMSPGGMELSVVPYLRHFSDQYDLFAYGIRPAKSKGLYSKASVALEEGAHENWRSYTEFWRYCRRYAHHRFHLLNTGPYILLMALIAGVRQPIYHIHGTVHGKTIPGKFLLRMAWGLTRFFALRIVANSPHSARKFRDGALSVQPEIIYNGIDTEPFLRLKRHRHELRRMAYVGRMVPAKGIERVLRLFDAVAGEYPKMELHLAGEGPLRKGLEAKAKKSPYASRIIFHGFIKDIPSFYASVDLLVFLSEGESFGNVVVEALLTGLPVICSDLPIFRDIFREEQGFILEDAPDFQMLLKAFLHKLEDFDQLSSKAMLLCEAMLHRFRLDKHLGEIALLYANSTLDPEVIPAQA